MQHTIKFLNFWMPENFALINLKLKQTTNLRVFCQKDANGIANSEVLYEQSDLGLHCLSRTICAKTSDYYVNQGMQSTCNLFSCSFFFVFEIGFIFSSPVQSTGRAIVVTLASALALALTLPLPFPSRHF